MGMVAPTDILCHEQAISHPYVFPTIKKLHIGVTQAEVGHRKILNLPAKFVSRIENLFGAGKYDSRLCGVRPPMGSLEDGYTPMNPSALTPHQENMLAQWIVSETEKGNHMDMVRLQRRARRLCSSNKFKASSYWVQSFVKRHPWIKESLYNVGGAPV